MILFLLLVLLNKLCNDIYYFCEEGKDYIINYIQTNAGINNEEDPIFESSIYLKDYSKFLHSASGLTQDDLAYGSLPQSTNEVVIYAEDESVLGTTFTCMFYFSLFNIIKLKRRDYIPPLKCYFTYQTIIPPPTTTSPS